MIHRQAKPSRHEDFEAQAWFLADLGFGFRIQGLRVKGLRVMDSGFKGLGSKD